MEIEEHALENVERAPCSKCGRNFALDSLSRHEPKCNPKARKVNSITARTDGTDAAKFVKVLLAKGELQVPQGSKQATHKSADSLQQPPSKVSKTAAAKPKPVAARNSNVTCPGCNRSFAEEPAARHIPQCILQQKYKKVAPKVDKNQTERMLKRTSYKPPLPGANRKTSTAA